MGAMVVKKTLETAVIAAVTVTTVFGTVNVLRGSSAANPIDTWVSAKWHDLQDRAVPSMAPSAGSDHPLPAASGKSGVGTNSTSVQSAGKTASNTNSTSSSGSSGGGSTVISTPPGKWTEADVTRLETIGVNLIFALTPADWQQIAQALSTGESSTTADQTLAQVLRQRLTAADRTWLLEHFTGGNAVNQEEVQLLQRSISQAESELTPAERKLLEDELNALKGQNGSAGNSTSSGVDRATQ